MTAAVDLKSGSLSLIGALTDPDVDDLVFVEAVVDAVEHRVVSETPAVVTADERGLTWWHLIEELAKLREKRVYIGAFRRVITKVTETAATLPATDHRVAAMVIIDQTTATAESLADFREGVLAARSIAPTILHPRLVVRRLLSTALCYVDDPQARVNAGYALRLTLEMLAQSDEQSLSLDDLETLSSAIDADLVDVNTLRTLGQQLHKKDRKPFLSLLPTVTDGRGRHKRH